MSMKKVVRGKTASIRLDTRYKGERKNADSAAITIYDPNFNKEVDSVAMTQVETGVYVYRWDISATAQPGIYSIIPYATVGTNNYADTMKLLVTEREVA